MEQRKLLWVILLVSLFVLMIFGSALFFYAPSQSGDTAYADGETIPYESGSYGETAVDPDKWSRNPDKVASLDTSAAPANGNIVNLTIVNDDTRQDNSIDVSTLTDQPQKEEKELPPELAEQIGLASKQQAEKRTGETAPVETEKPKVSGTLKKARSSRQAVVPKKTTKRVKKPIASKRNIPSKKRMLEKTAKKNPAPKMFFWVQAASLSNRMNAEKARERLVEQHMQVEVFTKETAAGLKYRVRVGPFINKTEAQYWLNNIKKIKDFSGSYISEERVKR